MNVLTLERLDLGGTSSNRQGGAERFTTGGQQIRGPLRIWCAGRRSGAM